MVLISYIIQCVENKHAKPEVVEYTERVKGESWNKQNCSTRVKEFINISNPKWKKNFE